ncbi:AAA family ATPase [candidate division WOR-3 bacterium]|nr:AAA family ATPase [candidate division WOR-3 bacterium]
MIRIKELTIKGFKRIKKAEIELSPGANLFLGHNEEGKSSMLDATIYVLTDSIQGQPKGAFIEAINDQCKTASVVITGQAGDSPFNIKRTLAKTNRSGPSPVQVGAQLGVDPHILSACLNANYYFDLDPAYQKKLIIKALGLKPTLRDAFITLHEKGYASNVCEEFWNEKIINEIDHLGWDAGYNAAYSLRREAGQKIKILEGDRPKLITQVAMGNRQILMDAIMATHKKKPLEKQEGAHQTRLKQLYKELGGIKALSEADKKEAEEQLSKYQTEKAELIAKKVKWTKTDTATATKLKKARDEFKTKMKEDIATLENLAETTEDLLAKNKENWVSDLKCPIYKESGHAMCPAIEPDWSQQQEEVDGVVARIMAVEERNFPEQKAWDDLSGKATECKDRFAHMEILERDIKELEKKLENTAPEAGEKKEALEISIEALEEKVEHLKVAQSAIIWNQATQETLDATRTKIDEAEAEREHYDKLCTLLAPDGIPGELVAEKLGTLNTRLKKHSEMMGVSIQFLDDLSLVQTNKKQLWTLGGAETSRVRMAVAEAISHCTGVGLVLLDELNISVASDAASVRVWLTEIAEEGVQIIAAAATNAPGPPNVPKNAPVRMFWVESGHIKRL